MIEGNTGDCAELQSGHIIKNALTFANAICQDRKIILKVWILF
jgi:hypothetical protein